MLSHINNLRRIVSCPICLGYLNDPVVSNVCQHSFCGVCLMKSIQLRQTCPVCMQVCREDDITSLSYAESVITKTVQLIEALDNKLLAYSATPSTDFGLTKNVSQKSVEPQPAVAFIVHKIGDVVNVKSRTWAGINKPGGTARVIATKFADDNLELTSQQRDLLYDVKYVLTSNTEKNIPSRFIETVEEVGIRTERKRITKANNDNLRGNKVLRKDSNLNPLINDDSNQATLSSCSEAHEELPGNNLRSVYTGKPVTLVTTGVSVDDEDLINQFVNRFHVNRSSYIFRQDGDNQTATHLVVPVDEEGVFPRRTMKYMEAIMKGLWIVNISWIKESLHKGRIVDEENFEVKSCCKAILDFAPKRARLYMCKSQKVLGLQSGIFSGSVILLHGYYPAPGPSRHQLLTLLTQGGATVCLTIQEFLKECFQKPRTLAPPYKYRVAICPTVPDKESFFSQVQSISGDIICGCEDYTSTELRATIENFIYNIKGKGVYTLIPLWILDCVSNYCIQPSLFQQYLVS